MKSATEQDKAWLRFYFKVEPDKLSMDKFIELRTQLYFCLKQTGKMEIK